MKPTAERPDVKDYGIPQTTDELLSFDDALEKLAGAQNFWLVTVRPDGRPHSVPVWGVVVDETVYFGGGPDTRKARNLDGNPNVVVHTESGDDVVIIEGEVWPVETDSEQERVDDAYEKKYDMRHGPQVWGVRPRVAFGWTEFPRTMTRWTFPP